jgi:hypothetical protein
MPAKRDVSWAARMPSPHGESWMVKERAIMVVDFRVGLWTRTPLYDRDCLQKCSDD